MPQEKEEIPVFIITGFLEAGKTTFIRQTLRQEYFQIDGTTLLIACEDGEETYHERALQEFDTILVQVDKSEDFTPQNLDKLDDAYFPERVIIEYNPLWGVDKLREMKLPAGWFISQEIMIIDCSTFEIYRKNMQSLFTEMAKKAEMILFNRSRSSYPLQSYRRGFKVVNPASALIFEDPDGESIDLFEDNPPYDMNAKIISIEDEDFGIFYIDMEDHPERYDGKTVTYKARALKSRRKDADYFVAGRQAMTCCAEDMQIIGHLVKGTDIDQLKHGEWVQVTAKVKVEYAHYYHGKGPVLYAALVEPCQPPREPLVYF